MSSNSQNRATGNTVQVTQHSTRSRCRSSQSQQHAKSHQYSTSSQRHANSSQPSKSSQPSSLSPSISQQTQSLLPEFESRSDSESSGSVNANHGSEYRNISSKTQSRLSPLHFNETRISHPTASARISTSSTRSSARIGSTPIALSSQQGSIPSSSASYHNSPPCDTLESPLATKSRSIYTISDENSRKVTELTKKKLEYHCLMINPWPTMEEWVDIVDQKWLESCEEKHIPYHCRSKNIEKLVRFVVYTSRMYIC
jgi:hypothetical protein